MTKLVGGAAFGLGLILLSGCVGNVDRPAMLAVAARNLRCSRAEMQSELSRETTRVREYHVGCDFVYTTVHCADARCFPAKPKPPCFGSGCFKEDPVTLEWTLDDPQLDSKRVAR